MPNLDDEIAELGMNRTNVVLPTLAHRVATAAAAGDIDEDSANEIFERYYTGGGKYQVDKHTTSFRVQCSKLRQIIKAKDPVLLREVTRVHNEVEPGGRKRSLYDTMVEASRFLVTRGTRPSARTIRQWVEKKR